MLIVKVQEKELEFVPDSFRRSFEDMVLVWYEEFCEAYTGCIPRPLLVSHELMHKGFVNQAEEISVHERSLSWIIGVILEAKQLADVSATMLDLTIKERIEFEEDMEKVMEQYQLVYVDPQTKRVKNNPVLEVW